MRLAAHDDPLVRHDGARLGGDLAPLPAELLGPDPGVTDRPDGGGEGQAGDEEGVLVARQPDRLLQVGV